MNYKHGHARKGKRSPTWMCWRSIINRCRNPNTKEFKKYYGGQGINICDRWLVFENFLEDMGEKPTPKHTIERIRNGEGYQPGNCKWATRKEQSRHRKTNRLVTINGVTKVLAAWLETTNIKKSTVSMRIQSGWTPEDALSVPTDRSRCPHKYR